MAVIHAYLVFNGNCREAMLFYQESFGGTLTLQTVNESPMHAQWPQQVQHCILHASLHNGDITLLATDMAGPDGTVVGNNLCLAIACHNRKEIQSFFTSLASGGKVNHALHDFPGGTIGGITDKFGITWVLKL